MYGQTPGSTSSWLIGTLFPSFSVGRRVTAYLSRTARFEVCNVNGYRQQLLFQLIDFYFRRMQQRIVNFAP